MNPMPLSFPFPIFYLAAAFFALFSLLYLIIAIAIIYHLRTYSISGRIAPHVVIIIFSAVSIVLWLLAIIFLLKLPQ